MNRHRLILLAPAAAALIALVGCATSQQAQSTLSSADQTFLENAAQGGHAEVQGSQMAVEKTESPDVKAFAQMMIKDHTAAGEELSALAKKKGYVEPTEPSVLQKTELKALSVLSGGAFDKMYVDRLGIAAHEATISQFEDAAFGAQDNDVRAFAEKTLPTLRKHLEAAQSLNAQQKTQ